MSLSIQAKRNTTMNKDSYRLYKEKKRCAGKNFSITTITLFIPHGCGRKLKILLCTLEKWLSQKRQIEEVEKFTAKAAL